MGLNLGHSELAKAAVVKSSVADPEPDSQELDVFGHPESGFISSRYGSGSFYNKEKIVRKTLIPTVL